MTYEEALTYIHSVSWRGRKPGLERIRVLCDLLGNPQKKLHFIHVAGTNGKGSVSAMTDSILRAAGLKVGLYTSPYLVDFTERIQFDGSPISHEDLCRVTEAVKAKADLMEDGPTEFELITAIAFQYYSEVKPDVIVLECGLGGRLDATNVIDESLLSVITNIALDHTDVLGDTVEKIAGEKAGILKGAPCVLGHAPAGAEKVILDKCREKGLPLIQAADLVLSDVAHTREGISFRYHSLSLFTPLSGVYQEKNIKTVLAVTEELKKQGFAIPDEALQKGFSSVYWPGRFETLLKEPRIIFDGAHNPDGIEGAVATCRALYPDERIILVSGVMKDKSFDTMVKTLAGISGKAYVGAPETPRSLPALELARALEQAGVHAVPCDSMTKALESAARDAAENGGVVLCVGSLYSYAELRQAARSLAGA